MLTADFDYALPPGSIALRPASPRDAARLMVVTPGAGLEHRLVSDLPGCLRAGDLMVFNDTRVIAGRLKGVRQRAGAATPVEATLLTRLSPHRWTALMRPGKRLKAGDAVRFGPNGALTATVEGKADAEVTLAFELGGEMLDAALDAHGLMPLPPYIAALRPEDAQDRADYQTVYAQKTGSVAAPTAGLHFTPELMARLASAGVCAAFVTLHVGAGTFLPVKAERVADHRMHAEAAVLTEETAARINDARAAGGRIVAVGTTALRLLETAADSEGVVHAFAGETGIFITPGYSFRAVDGLLSNFHLPRSTLLMLVSALAGIEATRAAYAAAVEGGYRFYSYGDAGLWWRA